MASKPKQHVSFEHGGEARLRKQVDPALVAQFRFLSGGPDDGFQSAISIETGLHKGHSEGAALCTDRVLEAFGFEIVEHEEDVSGRTSLQCRQHRIDLMGKQRYDDKIVGLIFVQFVTDADCNMLALCTDNPAIGQQLSKAVGTWSCNDHNLVATTTGQVKGESASDAANANHGDAKWA
ncbi:hypothetical protein J2Z84_004861 [Agrobacterium rubi]|nr:hypothetical protein [Agrobacterium rubi]MBP1881519.1 hypothetical protein [Agrobacterium rubi]